MQEAEINRREKELIATVLKQAEIERQRIETLALAEKQRLMSEAEGHASSIRQQGEAEAEIIFKKGEAEAKAMNVKAEAFQEYNQAAVIDKLLTSLPEIVRALANEPRMNAEELTAAKKNLGWPLEPTFLVPEGATALDPVGTAPGLRHHHEQGAIRPSTAEVTPGDIDETLEVLRDFSSIFFRDELVEARQHNAVKRVLARWLRYDVIVLDLMLPRLKP